MTKSERKRICKALESRMRTLSRLLSQYEQHLEHRDKTNVFVLKKDAELDDGTVLKEDTVFIEYYAHHIGHDGIKPVAYRDFTLRDFPLSEEALDRAINRIRQKIYREQKRQENGGEDTADN